MKNSQKIFFVTISIIILATLAVASKFLYYPKSSVIKTEPLASQNLINYQMVSANNPQYSYPLIKDYPDKIAMDKVSKTLSENFNDFGCDPRTPKDKINWNVKISVDYAQNDIFSVNESGDYDCGGAYPTNNYSSTLTFDMKTGEQITFQKLFKNYEKDKNEINNVIYSEVISNDCGDVAPESLVDFSQDYRISSKTKTIKVRPDLPHVVEACVKEAEIPIQKLLPFIDTTSILNRI